MLIYMVIDAGRGGHTRTAVTLARAMQRRGHDIGFVVGHYADTRVIDQFGFPYWRVSESPRGRIPSLPAAVEALAARQTVDAIHTFSWRGLPSAVDFCRMRDVSLAWTVCGGRPPRRIPAGARLVSLSDEVKTAIVEAGMTSPDRVEVVRARVDLDDEALRRAALDDVELDSAFASLGLDPAIPTVCRVARVHPAYFRSIVEGVEAVGMLVDAGREVQFVHVGYVDRGSELLRRELESKIRSLNDRAGRVVAISTDLLSTTSASVLRRAAVAIGTGRTAFEAMLANVPTVVVGPQGFAGRCDPTDIGVLASFNFSGRNQTGLPDKESVERLRSTLDELLSSPAEAVRIGRFGAEFVEQNYDVALAVPAYERIYVSAVDLPTVEAIKSYEWAMVPRTARIWLAARTPDAILPVLERGLHWARRLLRSRSTVGQAME